MRILSIVLLIVLLALQYPVWLAKGSWSDVWHTENVLTAKEEANKKLKIRNEALAAEVFDLKEGNEAIEERARAELGLIKADETFFQVLVKKQPEPELVVLPTQVATAGRPIELPKPAASVASAASTASASAPVVREPARPRPKPVIVSPPVDTDSVPVPEEQNNDLPQPTDDSPPPANNEPADQL